MEKTNNKCLFIAWGNRARTSHLPIRPPGGGSKSEQRVITWCVDVRQQRLLRRPRLQRDLFVVIDGLQQEELLRRQVSHPTMNDVEREYDGGDRDILHHGKHRVSCHGTTHVKDGVGGVDGWISNAVETGKNSQVDRVVDGRQLLYGTLPRFINSVLLASDQFYEELYLKENYCKLVIKPVAGKTNMKLSY